VRAVSVDVQWGERVEQRPQELSHFRVVATETARLGAQCTREYRALLVSGGTRSRPTPKRDDAEICFDVVS
jgi:hypothetical protein